MLTQVPRPMFVDYFSAFAPWCDSGTVDNGCLSTVVNDGSKCSLSKNAVRSETRDASSTESSDVPMLESASSCDKSVKWSDFVVTVDNDGSIE